MNPTIPNDNINICFVELQTYCQVNGVFLALS